MPPPCARVHVVGSAFVQHYDVMAQAAQGRGTHRRRDTYHHGDLPNALADAATEMARAGGPDAVILRAAARGELLYVVRMRALDELADAMSRSLQSVQPQADPAEEAVRRMRALGRAYIDFALTDPGLFRTAFCRPDKPLPDAAERMASGGPYALLSGVLDELVRCGVLEESRRAGAEIPAWAAVHGLATLLIDGPLALLGPQERADAIDRCADFVLNGVRGSR